MVDGRRHLANVLTQPGVRRLAGQGHGCPTSSTRQANGFTITDAKNGLTSRGTSPAGARGRARSPLSAEHDLDTAHGIPLWGAYH